MNTPMILDIIIPTRGRPHLLQPLVLNIESMTPPGAYYITFVVNDDDLPTIKTLAGAPGPVTTIVTSKRGYPKAVNVGVAATRMPLVAIVNDDTYFHPEWFAKLYWALEPEYMVYGTNDLSPHVADGENCTQPVVLREYIEQAGGNYGEPGKAYHEGYHHNFCETEMWLLAQHRGIARYVPECVIEHIHPDWGKAKMDKTYEEGAKSHWDADAALFEERKALWLTS